MSINIAIGKLIKATDIKTVAPILIPAVVLYTVYEGGKWLYTKGVKNGYQEANKETEEASVVEPCKYNMPDKDIVGIKGEKKVEEKLSKVFDWYVTNLEYKGMEIDILGYKNGNLYLLEVKNWSGIWDLADKESHDSFRCNPDTGDIICGTNRNEEARRNPNRQLSIIKKELEKKAYRMMNKSLPIESYVIMANPTSYLSDCLEVSTVFKDTDEVMEIINESSKGLWTMDMVVRLSKELKKLDTIVQSDGTIVNGAIKKHYYNLYTDDKLTKPIRINIRDYKKIDIEEKCGKCIYRCNLTNKKDKIEKYYQSGEIVEIDVYNGHKGENSPIDLSKIKEVFINSWKPVIG